MYEAALVREVGRHCAASPLPSVGSRLTAAVVAAACRIFLAGHGLVPALAGGFFVLSLQGSPHYLSINSSVGGQGVTWA